MMGDKTLIKRFNLHMKEDEATQLKIASYYSGETMNTFARKAIALRAEQCVENENVGKKVKVD